MNSLNLDMFRVFVKGGVKGYEAYCFIVLMHGLWGSRRGVEFFE